MLIRPEVSVASITTMGSFEFGFLASGSFRLEFPTSGSWEFSWFEFEFELYIFTIPAQFRDQTGPVFGQAACQGRLSLDPWVEGALDKKGPIPVG